MKVHIALLLVAIFAIFQVEAKNSKKKMMAVSSNKSPNTDNDSDSQSDGAFSDKPKLGKQDAALAKVFQKMSNQKTGAVIDLDSSFGGSKCNCVCKDLDEI